MFSDGLRDGDGQETPQLGSKRTSLKNDSIDSQPNALFNSKKSVASSEAAPKQPRFFLYTKLNQNQTKSLKKVGTNVGERRVLAEIFSLKTITNVAPNESPSKVELLKLDFHFMNYMFCKKRQYSNEKVSTMLAIFSHVFNEMLEK